MSLEIEDQRTVEKPAETNNESEKKSKITYTRDLLISLSELDICKKIPIGIDTSLLSELEDASQDRQKGSGSLSMHSFRRNEYGSSPPTRGESGNYSRGIHGRWDSRSSGRSDKDSDSQSDWDSDTGRRYGSQSRRSWQVPEHDGLLGSGSLARPSGYATGASAPKFRANDNYQPNKSNEPYQPPRPYKAVPHNRRETDSLNDETFGSSEHTSEDRAEEEKKRRASFELMRKEQHKAFQEKQKLNTNKRKDEFDTLVEDSKDDDGVSNKSSQFDEPGSLPDPSNVSDKSVLPTQTPASRPLVPPGFANATLERNIGTKTIAHPHSSEVGNSELEGGILHGKGKRLLNGTFDNQEKQSAEQTGLSDQHESIIVHVSHNNENDKVQKLTSALDVSNKKMGMDGRLYKTSNLSKAVEASDESEGIELDAEVADSKIQGESSRDQPSSILNKLFGNVLTANGGGSNILVEHHDSKAEDMWSPTTVQSSKFAHWFLEEEKKPVANLSSGMPNNLLSLIVGGEKGGSQVSDVKVTNRVPPKFPSQTPEVGDKHLAPNVASAMIENSEHLCNININKPAAIPAVLTCEDLEQSILSGISDSDATLPPNVRGWGVDAKAEQKKVNIDNHASQHILSLLQKSTDLKDATPFPGLDIRSSEIPHSVDVTNIGTGLHDSRDANAENVSNSGKSLTLETLFGTAFMKELQSVGVPSSAQKESADDALEMHDGLLSSKVKLGSSGTSYESSILASNHREPMKTDSLKEHLIGFDNCRTELDSSQFRSELGLKLGGFDRSANIRFPEEDSLTTLGDPMKHLKNSSKAELFSTHAAPVDITEKLAALKSSFGDERPIAGGQEGLPYRRGPYAVREADIPFHNLHLQPSSAQLHPPQLNHVGQLFNPLESHHTGINSQMKFMSPESIIRHDSPPTHQFPGNMPRPPFHHPSTGLAGFDPPTHQHSMFQQMHMPGNFPPPHLVRGFPNTHSNSHMTGFMQDANPMPGLPFGHQQPNFAGHGMPPPAPDIGGGSNNPEALQRLLEMELRSNSKHVHPFAGAGPNKGMYNQELDMGSRYR
ncbi:hypothetical protein Ddye_017701 [Dipteronia dyeriana]|uniref:Uncharacterized protein n=1 Tax=Dipteronia dyeriana TaxID=168575 RepID=A0AAD9U968_9ROSI|nr:hypothetical protein Ddye_017701 [Dipteronia dyeriana]